MVLNASTGHSRSGSRPKAASNQLTFDFIVAERPIYTPGSGPPLAPISVMPAHDKDKDGIIESEVRMGKKSYYIVVFEGHPYLKVKVSPDKILNWVTARTYEDFETAKTQAALQAEKDELLPKIAAKQKLKEQVQASRVNDAPQGPGRKGKRGVSAEKESTMGLKTSPLTPGRKRKPEDDEEDELASVPRRPSLSSPTKHRGLAEVVNLEESEDDSAEDTSLLLARQLNVSHMARQSGLRVEVLGSPSRSPTGTTSPEPKPQKTSRFRKSALPPLDRQTRSGSISSANTPGSRRETRSSSTSNSRPSSRHAATAGTSSLRAGSIYEKLERNKDKARPGSLTEKYSYTGKKPKSKASPTQRKKSTTPKHKKSTTPKPPPVVVEEEEDDEEYEVDGILAHEYRLDKKKNHQLWYLIKWVGDYENTWEPAKNVGSAAVAEYEAKQRREEEEMSFARPSSRSKKAMHPQAETDDDDDEFNLDLGKRKRPFASGAAKVRGSEKRGMLENDEDEDESDEDSLFVKDRTQSKVVSSLQGMQPKMKRAEVIDDAASFEGDF